MRTAFGVPCVGGDFVMHVGRVALVVPYFNAGHRLVDSLKGVRLREDDLILVVDDGSKSVRASDWCPNVVGDTPVELLVLDSNQGIAGALRSGLEYLGGRFDYIARLDCGDSCKESRFELQRSVLDQDPGIVLVGSNVVFTDSMGKMLYVLKLPSSDKAIRSRMRVNCALIHPAVMFRKSAYDTTEGYRLDREAAEDFALFSSLLKVGRAINLQDVLVECATSDGGISETSRKQQIWTRVVILKEGFDGSLMAVYGLGRALVQYHTPRSLTTVLRRTVFRRG